jgi:formylglycine-generating enzyme required for sulfatase activity
MSFVKLPGGQFLMGLEGAEDAVPVHPVGVKEFWIGQYEVTNREYEAFHKRTRSTKSPTDRHPALGVSWDEAAKFCDWLSKKERLRYRLPTEAEWEYAARGGLVQKKFPWGDQSPDGRATVAALAPTAVGSYSPNGFQLYDMAGYVQEWVSDWYDPKYYSESPSVNPTGPPSGKHKVVRGGFYSAWDPYCGLRLPYPPDARDEINGFRVVLDTRDKDPG